MTADLRAAPLVSLDDVRAAAARLTDRVHRTPVRRSTSLGELWGVRLDLKAEVFQRTGSFKARGALKMNCRPSPSIVPHSAVGDCTPSPRKPRPAASRMLTPMLSVPCTSTGVSELRNTCRVMIRRLLAPSARAAST